MDTNGHKRTPYEETKARLERLNEGVRRGERWTVEGKRTILAMARKNDPFYAGQDWQRERAEWFADLFRRLGFEDRRVHIRFVHYVASGEEPNPETGEKRQERKPDGTPYENTQDNWNYIQEASKHARNMGLVDPRRIVDKRTLRPFMNAPDASPDAPGVRLVEPFIHFPSIEVDDLKPRMYGGLAYSTGYEYDVAFEPSLVEVWMEKSLDDADDPMIEVLCQEEGVNLVTGIGFMTISSVYALLDRRSRLGKPLRILYLSDFDPAGSHMPSAPARHIEFALRDMEEKPDIRLRHLALTEDQVRELELPRIPIKDSDRRKAGFEAKHGQGATELNALMHGPRRERTEAMLRDAKRVADGMLRAEMARRLRWPRRALELIEQEAKEIAGRYEEELRKLSEKLAEEIEPLEERAERVLQVVRHRVAGLEEDVDLPEAEGEEPLGAASGWLFDTRRDYLEQLGYYKER